MRDGVPQSPARQESSFLTMGKEGPAESGRGDRIRTCDILLPKQARYQTALRPDSVKTLILLPFQPMS